jgi:hypothetical protein
MMSDSIEGSSQQSRITAFAGTAQITISEEFDEVTDLDTGGISEDFSIFENMDGLSDDMRFLVCNFFEDSKIRFPLAKANLVDHQNVIFPL